MTLYSKDGALAFDIDYFVDDYPKLQLVLQFVSVSLICSFRDEVELEFNLCAYVLWTGNAIHYLLAFLLANLENVYLIHE